MSSLDEITSSSDSDDLPHSSSSSSTDLSVEIYGNGGYRQFINNTVQKKPANRLMKSSKPATVVNSTMNVQPPPAAVFTRQSQSETTLPNESQHNHPENFNLIEYLKEVTQTSEEKIRSLCKEQGVSPNEKPHVVIINDLLEKIMAEEVIVLDDSSVSNEVTPVPVPMDIPEQACISNGPALPTGENEISPRIKKEKDAPPSTVTADQNGNPSAKECNSRKPVIIRAPRLFIAPEQNSSCEFQPINLSPSKRKLIKPARLNIEPRSPEAIPAMPLPFLDHIRNAANPRQLPEVNEAASGPFAVEHQSDVHNKAVLDLNLPENPEAGPSKKKNRPIEEKLVLRLIEMFPQACPDYIRRVCRGKDWNEFDEVVTVILSAEDYPKRPDRIPSPQKEFDLEEQLEIVKALLPDADPIFLRCKCEEIGNNLEHLNEFIYSLRETKDYPTMKEYLRKQKLSAQSRQYTTEFNVENFVQLFPEPEKTFTDSKRALKIDPYTALYITNFFQNKYDRLPVKTVRSILSHNNFKLIESDNLMIDAINNNQVMRSRRKRQTLTDVPQNINVLQELAYITHKEEIETLLREKKEKEEQDRQNAKENGLMISCQCCYDEEVMVKDSFSCPKDCRFCRDCIQKSCEIALGEGKTEYNCLNDCPEQFTLQTLQNVLPPKMFSKLAQKKTLAEVKAAGIAELEMCPFCDFASIPNETDKIFRCLNPDCMKESCRTCKEENHIPYRCDELEKDEEVKARVHVENKMTEALLRKCWKCGTSFFKEEGCNKMTCTCGAKMCYICKAPVTDYSHFNGIGGDKYHLCPLYSDSNLINQQAVMGAAQAAIAEVDPAKLKVDPTLDVEKHFQERKKALPREAHMDYLGDVELDFLHQEQQRRQEQ
ncbi:hypothetical protein JTB14_021080 [Gonioctena quinquepunctata]|nr:hypothetical protein JTB14_021080 [Gonioctena quinquepunctata]